MDFMDDGTYINFNIDDSKLLAVDKKRRIKGISLAVIFFKDIIALWSDSSVPGFPKVCVF